MPATITLTPSELADVKRMAARDIATVSSFTGVPVERVARLMPIIELGPRSRRVRISD